METSAEVDLKTAAEQARTSGSLSSGSKLRKARENLGLSLSDIAGSLNLKPDTISALEKGDYSELPEMAYVRGYVRGYARLVGLSESEVLDNFPELQIADHGEPRPGGMIRHRRPRSSMHQGKSTGIWVIVVLAIVVALGWWIIGSGIDSPSSLFSRFKSSDDSEELGSSIGVDQAGGSVEPGLQPQNGVSSQIIINNFGEESSLSSNPPRDERQRSFQSGETVITLSPPTEGQPNGAAGSSEQPQGINVVREVTTFPSDSSD